jgi:hypothetical protein
MTTVTTPEAVATRMDPASGCGGRRQAVRPWSATCREQQARRQSEEAHQRLHQSGYAALSQLRCECGRGALVLHGHVPSYYLKQLAQTLVRDIGGVNIIVNKVRVD